MFKCLYTFDEHHREYLNSLSISSDGIILAGCFHNLVKVWDLTTRKVSHSFKLHGDRYGHFHTLVNPNWTTIISDDRYGNLRTYDFWTGEELFSFPGNSSALAFAPDGRVLFQGICEPHDITNGRIKIQVIEFFTGQLLHTLLFANEYFPLRSLLPSPDGNILIAQSSDVLTQVWDWQNRRLLSTLNALRSSSPRHSSKPICRHWLDAVATRPNGQSIAAVAHRDKSSEETTIAIWDLQTTEVLHTLGISHRQPPEGMPHSAITPDGSLLAVGNNKEIEVWDVESKQQICVLYGHKSRIDHLTVSVDGKTIVSQAWNDSIKVWYDN